MCKEQPSCLIVVDSLDAPHGTEMFSCIVAKELHERGWRVRFHTAHYDPKHSAWTGLVREMGALVWRPHFWFLTRYELPSVVSAWFFRGVCRRFAPDIIWSPTTDTLTTLCLLANVKMQGPPFFVHDPNDASMCPHLPKKWPHVSGLATGMSVHGVRQMHGAEKAYGRTSPIEVVWPGSLPPSIKPVLPTFDRKPIRFGQFGRLYSMKGALFTVAAFAKCLQTTGGAELHFYGDGPQLGDVWELATSLGIADKVFFHGSYHHTKMDELMAEVDVGLMPSIYEGFGLVMLELMARGRPVISSDVGSSKEVLEAFDCGIVVPRADVDGLATAMISAVKDTERMRKMSVQARRVWLEHFTPSAFVDRLLGFWGKHCHSF
jgi:glycosyltransferase involved in cell wall biosynthesis